MPPLPVISGQEAIKAFNKIGYAINRQKGSHITLIKVGCFPLTIPDHKELAKGTLKALLRTAGISVEEFNKLID